MDSTTGAEGLAADLYGTAGEIDNNLNYLQSIDDRCALSSLLIRTGKLVDEQSATIAALRQTVERLEGEKDFAQRAWYAIRDESDKSADQNYRNGFMAGWNACTDGNEALLHSTKEARCADAALQSQVEARREALSPETLHQAIAALRGKEGECRYQLRQPDMPDSMVSNWLTMATEARKAGDALNALRTALQGADGDSHE